MAAHVLDHVWVLVLAASMLAVGVLGYTGRITDTTPVIVGCFVAATLLAFSLGRQSRDVF